jgi:flagellin-like protein
MFEFITDSEERGQVGIGTLIVFIALVLVAAVAAGVLINTAGELQSRASDTGDDAQAQVSNQIDVVSATGEDVGTDGDVDTVTLVVKKSPGSDPINLSAATIQYTSQDTSKTLTYAGDSGSAGTSEFATSDIKGTGSSATLLDDTSERVKITIDVASVNSALSAGASAELKIVDQSGATTTYGVNVPEVVSDQYVSV